MAAKGIAVMKRDDELDAVGFHLVYSLRRGTSVFVMLGEYGRLFKI